MIEEVAFQITSDVREEQMAPVPYAKITLPLPKLRLTLKPMTAVPSSEHINYRATRGRSLKHDLQ